MLLFLAQSNIIEYNRRLPFLNRTSFNHLHPFLPEQSTSPHTHTNIFAEMSICLKEFCSIDVPHANPCNFGSSWSESVKKRIAFVPDGDFGACLITPKTLVTFQLKEIANVITTTGDHIIQCPQQVTTFTFGRNGSKNCGKSSSLGDYFLGLGQPNGEILIWNPETCSLVARLLSHSGRITDLAFTPRKTGHVQLLSVSIDCKLKVWDNEEKYDWNMSQTKIHDDVLQCIAWSGSGSLVATAGNSRAVYVYSMAQKIQEQVYVLRGHLSSILSLQFSSDQNTLMSASSDTRVNLWDCLTGSLRQTLCHAFPVPQLLFGDSKVRHAEIGNDGSAIFTITNDENLRVWNPLDAHCDIALTKAHALVSSIVPPLLPLRITPQESIDLKTAGRSNSFTVLRQGRLVAVTSERSHKIQIYKCELPCPKLSELCRVAIRQLLPVKIVGTGDLPLPRILQSYLLHQ